jgi:hypothetical protein
MGKWFVMMLAMLTGCVSTKESDSGWMYGWHIESMDIYSARTNELIRTVTIDNWYFYRITQGSRWILSMELDGQTVWRLEGHKNDIFEPDETDDRLQLNLSKYEYLVIKFLDGSDAIMMLQNGGIVNGFNGIVDENEPVYIHINMTGI